MEPSQSLWKTMECYGTSWEVMEGNERPRKIIKHYGKFMKIMEISKDYFPSSTSNT